MALSLQIELARALKNSVVLVAWIERIAGNRLRCLLVCQRRLL